MSDAAIQIAETIQTGSINRAPSPRHDLNPSTVSAEKQPVALSDDIDADDIEGDEVSSGILRPIPRRANLPPLPDLRFEQSYLASISGAKTKWEVAYITIQNQILQPLLQGTLWSLALLGWRSWNRSASFSGRTVGSRVRTWWYGVNNWRIPDQREAALAAEVQEYYTMQSSSSGGD